MIITTVKALLPAGATICLALMPRIGAAGQTVGPNINLTAAAGNQYEAAVAIDPNNRDHIFVVGRNEVGGLATARTSDGGVTWVRTFIGLANPAQPGNIPRAYGNASVAWDVFGNIFLAYLSQNSSTSQFLYVTVAVSVDDGATFYAPTGVGPAIILPSNVSPYSTGDQPTIAVGPGSGGYPGSVWVTYFSVGGIWVSGAGVSAIGAVGPFTSHQLPAPTGNFGDIAVGPHGEVAVTYGPVSTASGAISINVDPDGLGPAPFSAGTPAVAVNLGGFSYIPAQPNWGIDPEAGLAYDRSSGPHRGRLYLLYTDAPAIGSYDTNIFVVSSDDQGTTWSSPVRVNDDGGANSQFLPRLSLDQSNGMLAATWYDARNSPANDTTQYFGAFSADGGATFGPNFQISVGTSDQANSVAALRKADYGDYTGNAFSNGRLVPAWADNSNSTLDNPDLATDFDIYVAIIQVSAGSSPEVSLAFPDHSATGWYTSAVVTGTVTATSPASTIADVTCTGATVSNMAGIGTPSASATLTVATQGHNAITCNATDSAGGIGDSPILAVLIDSVSPALSPTLSSSATPLLLNASVFALPNASDSGSGVSSAACEPIDTSAAGTHTSSCTAIDHAGNTTTVIIDYIVGFTIANVSLSPDSPIRAGSTLYAMFQLIDANGRAITDAIAKGLGCSVSASFGSEAPDCADYNPSKDRFDARVKTSSKLAPGMYPVVLSVMQGDVVLATTTVPVVLK